MFSGISIAKIAKETGVLLAFALNIGYIANVH